jgi:hypothetical protein
MKHVIIIDGNESPLKWGFFFHEDVEKLDMRRVLFKLVPNGWNKIDCISGRATCVLCRSITGNIRSIMLRVENNDIIGDKQFIDIRLSQTCEDCYQEIVIRTLEEC